MTADTARPDTVGPDALPERWTADRSAIEETLAALSHLPGPARGVRPTRVWLEGPSAPAQAAPGRDAAPLPTRRSLREAADQGHSASAGGRAGLFSRMLTVRAFRTRGAEAARQSRSDGVVAELLGAAAVHGVVALRHRRVPGQRAVVEHLAVGPSGVFVIDVRNARKASVEARPRGATSDLVVDGQDTTTAVTATGRRVGAVRSVLASAGLEDVTVTGVLCVVDGLLPLGVSDLEVRGIHVIAPTTLTALVSRSGNLDEEHRLTLQEYFAQQLPPAR
ncbi:hypothetical protein GCM10027517_04930 [Phycicoccus ginsengisoli]